MHGTIDKVILQNEQDAALVAEVEALFKRELELEQQMVQDGVDAYNAALDKQTKRQTLHHNSAYRQLTETLVVPLAQCIDMFRHKAGMKRGMRPVAYKLLAGMPSDRIALVIVNALVARVAAMAGREDVRLKLTATAHGFARQLEAEAKMAAWRDAFPDMFNTKQYYLERDGATAPWRRQVNIFTFNSRVKDEIDWKGWTHDERVQVGVKAIEWLLTIAPTMMSLEQQHDREYVVVLNPEMMSSLVTAVAARATSMPHLAPMVYKPKPWSRMRDGGYYSSPLRGRRAMIRFKSEHEEQHGIALDEFDAVDMPEVYDALNTMQEVPWRINRPVLAVAEAIWERDLAIAGVPKQKLPPKPVRPEAADTDEAVATEWKRRAHDWYTESHKLAARLKRAQRTYTIARRYADDTFYFPHTLDFRGRMYPLPTDLSPQGDDFARGLLTFAEGKPVDANSAQWLAVQVANCWGNDKISFEERVAWVEQNEAMWRSIAADPLSDRRWADDGHDCWQLLAAVFEWVRWLDEGEGMVSALPIRVDGTCNGIQHLSAMIRDAEGGAGVNLLPSESPRDIYREVAMMCEAALREMVEGHDKDAALAAYWLEKLGGTLPRTLTKRPVMILPYGGTIDAYVKYTNEWIDEHYPNAFGRKHTTERSTYVRFIATVMWQQVGIRLKRAREVQKWLQDCARLAYVSGLALRWVVPSGFVVRHFYSKRKSRRIATFLDGQKIKIVDWEDTGELSLEDQLRGIPPNFTHSLDASVLVTSMNKAWRGGVDMLTSIHDAYGTVAADVDTLNAALRQSFVETYRDHDVLDEFRNSCMDVLDDDYVHIAAMPQPPRRGSLDIEDVLDSPYFFA